MTSTELQQQHVFISHAGEDKDSFVRPLVNLFQKRYPSVTVFFDADSLQPAREAQRDIYDSLDRSHIVVIVLSRHFVRKPYPMDELRHVLARRGSSDNDKQQANQRQWLLPVLLESLPYDSADDLLPEYRGAQWPGKPEDNVLERWAQDVQQLLRITGIFAAKFEGGLLEHLERVVEETKNLLVAHALMPACDLAPSVEMPAVHLPRPTECDSVVEALQAHRIVLLHGSAGNGKSTLAKEVYCRLLQRQEFRCLPCHFISLHRVMTANDIRRQQKHLLRLLLREEKVEVRSEEEGRSRLADALRGRRLLLVVDGACTARETQHGLPQLQQLLPQGVAQSLAEGSFLLLTSRDCRAADGFAAHQWHLPAVGLGQAVLWLNRLVFGTDRAPTSERADVVEWLAQQCNGLPMALEAVGLWLRERKHEPKAWESGESILLAALQLQQLPGTRQTVWQVYRQEVACLQPEAWEALLDVVGHNFFWVQQSKLQACYGGALEELLSRSLVRQAGWAQTVELDVWSRAKTGPRLGICTPLRKFCQWAMSAAVELEGQGAIRCRLNLSNRKEKATGILGDRTAYAVLRTVCVVEDSGCPDGSTLRGLHMRGSRIKEWLLTLDFRNLLHFQLSMSDAELHALECLVGKSRSDSIRKAVLKLSIREDYIPQDWVATMRRLRVMELWDLEDTDLLLPVLPELRWLKLQAFRRLACCCTHLPAQLPKLQRLELINLPALQGAALFGFALPPSLEVLAIANCPGITHTPTLAPLTRLTLLALLHCPQLQHLHPNLGPLSSLSSLIIRACPQLTGLPGLELLPALKQLDVDGIGAASSIPPPASATGLSSLTIVSYTQPLAPALHVPPCTPLLTLTLCQCAALTSLPDLAPLLCLRDVHIQQCYLLSCISPLAAVTSLQRLTLQDTAVTALPPLAAPSLLALTAVRCPRLATLPPAATFQRATHLTLSDLPQATSLPPATSLTALSTLTITNCPQAAPLNFLSALHRLKSITLSNTPVEQPHQLSHLTALTHLHAAAPVSHAAVTALTPAQLHTISALHLDTDCPRAASKLPDLLCAFRSASFHKPSAAGAAVTLEAQGSSDKGVVQLEVRGDFQDPSELPDLSALPAVRSLSFRNCSKLQELPESMRYLGQLTELQVVSCAALTRLEVLGHDRLRSLQRVTTQDVPDSVRSAVGWVKEHVRR